MRLLVCGGRDFTDVEYTVPRLLKLHTKTPVTTLICGMASGADSIGLAWARELRIPVAEYPADWKKHGKAAGPIRNRQMLNDGNPDACLALPGGNGTADMINLCRNAGVPVVAYRWNHFRKEDPVWGFLSNFYTREFYGPGQILYKTNEHYYQSEKTIDPEWKHKIISAETPNLAKKLGNSNKLPLRKDWDEYKLIAMMNGIRLKFPATTDEEITCRLLHTGDDYLVEYAPWGDTFWGVDKNHKGLNWLGRLLMRRRDEILTGRQIY